MARQTFNPGALPDGAGGDTNRTAHQKWDSNFGELYTSVASLDTSVASLGASVVSANSYSGILQGFKNKIINGDFRHWQRGTSFAAATGARYTSDRWNAVGSGTTISVNIGSAYVDGFLPRSRNTLRAVISSVAGAANNAYLQTRIEGVETLASGKATFSMKAKCSSGTFKVGVELAQNFGSGGSAQINSIGQSITLTTSWQRFNFTVDIPSISGKTVGAGNNLQLTIWLDAGSDSASRSFSAGQKSGTVEFSEVQLEDGERATSYEFLPDSVSTQLVQRYYERINSASFSGTVYTPNGEIRGSFATWAAMKRISPSVTYTGTPSVFAFGRSAELVNASPGTLTLSGYPGGYSVTSMSNFANFQSIGAVGVLSSGNTLTIFGDAEL